jgi:hypothetical protein
VEIKLHHSLTYTTDGVVPVHLVAKSLLANERLIHESLRLLEGLDKDFKIDSIKVSVAKLSNESPLKEAMAIAVFVAYQHDLEKELPQLIQTLTGHSIPDGQVTLVTVLVFLVSIYLIDAAIERLMPGKSVKAIKAEYEEKKLLVSSLLKLSPDAIEEAVKNRFGEGRSKSLTSKVYEFFAPAKIESNTEITTDNNFRISLEAIKEIPSALDFAQMEKTNSYELDAVLIEIHRADRDETKHGWRAIIRDVSDRKTRMELDADIQPEELYGKTVLRGDVTIIEDLKDDGDYQVKAYLLRKVGE